MKGKSLVAIVALVFLALPALACGGSGGAAASANCPDGWEVMRLGGIYHGIAIEVAGSERQCASGICASFEGQLHLANTVEAAWAKCGSDCWGIPNEKHALCSLEGWVMAQWDGQSNHVCAKFEPY